MNPTAPRVHIELNRLGDYHSAMGISRVKKEFLESLPTFGPYKYNNDGSTYLGQFLTGLRTGRGTQINTDGTIYEGYWELDVKHGMGRKIFTSGDYSIGRWKNDKQNGLNTYYIKNGVSIESRWNDGVPCFKEVVKRWPDGSWYRGAINKKYDRHGYGVFKSNDKSEYSG